MDSASQRRYGAWDMNQPERDIEQCAAGRDAGEGARDPSPAAGDLWEQRPTQLWTTTR